ncbi:MAG: hypothetical protein P8M53_12765 [Pirellulales bacterium]|nr:hypothetical protein [Pirellulales bacterium]
MTVARLKPGPMRWVVPEEDQSLLVAPAPDQVSSILAANRELLWNSQEHQGYDLQGYTHGELLKICREELLQKAISYTRSYRDVALPVQSDAFSLPIIVGGHQPDIFHPGVWAKNFAIDRWSRENCGVGLQILIDTDVPKSLGMNVPGGSLEDPRLQYIELDRRRDRVPYEAWEVQDTAAFQSFGNRVTQCIAPLVGDPFMNRYWPKVMERSKVVRQVGLCIAQARHQFEAEWGLQTLELPQSEVCKGSVFRWFTAHLLAHLPRFHEIHNSVLAEYRDQNRLRNNAHPVPDLNAAENWLEAPFWIWSDQDPHRRPLHCHYQGDKLLLTGDKGIEFSIQATPEGDLHTAVEQLATAEAEGIHIRSRALVTTMFARLFCGDLFVHGIGGGNYDRLTDEMIQRFFGLQSPEYMVVSGTLRLPLQKTGASSEDIRRCDARLRDLIFNPDRILRQSANLNTSSSCENWIAEKQQWIATPLTPENGSTRHQAIHRCNTALQPFVQELSDAFHAERKQLVAKIRADKILAARDYAFCLFPENLLGEFLLDSVGRSL